MKFGTLLSACIVLGSSMTSGLCAPAPQTHSLLRIADKSRPVRIVCSKSADEIQMGQYLIKYLEARDFTVEPKISNKFTVDYAGPQWVLTTTNSYKSLKMDSPCPEFSKTCRDEAFILDAHNSKKGAEVLIVSKGLPGLRSGVARLLGKFANDGNSLWLQPGKELRDPFIRLRMLTASNAARRQAPKSSPFRDADCQTWSLDRLAAYPELFWQMGFNGMQVDEDRGYGSVKGEDLKRIQNALQTMMRSARDYHLSVSLSQWGDCLFNEGEAYSWNDPKEHAVMLSFMNDLAENYAPLVDNITIRVGDPGGCTRDECDFYKTPQELTAAYLKAFRKVNPSVNGTLSVWGNVDFWKHSPKKLDLSNYVPMFIGKSTQIDFGIPLQDNAKFLDETYMPKDVSIALNRYYNADQSEAVLAAGRAVDIKGWYIADMEMIDNICINMRTPDQLFSNMPDKARDQVRSQSVELCFDGWPQIINQYVAAQKLWNPRLKLEDIKKEFCVAAFGPQNADAMVELYNACENGDPDTYILPIPNPADFGTAEYNAKLHRVLAKAETVKLNPNWKPNFSFPVPAQKYVGMLTARLRLMISVSEAKEKIDAVKKTGGSPSEINEIKQDAIKSLPVLPIDPLYSQDSNVVDPSFKSVSFAEMIQRL